MKPIAERLETMDAVSWALLHYFLPVGLVTLLYVSFPWIRSFLEKSHLPLRERRIEILIDDYKWVKGFSADKRFPIIRLAGLTTVYLLYPLGVVIVGSIILRWYYPDTAQINITFVLTWIVGLSLAYYSILLFGNYIRGIISGYLFDKYKRQTIEKLIKLGGNPEELDKEDVG
jgi:hypothetical protein